jgi:hypothetical protein
MSNHSDPHSHIDSDDGHQAHIHGAVDPLMLTTDRGMWALKWSSGPILKTPI